MKTETITKNDKGCPNPSVGIWWFYNDTVLLSDPIETDKGNVYGDCITGLTDHADFWDLAIKNNKLESLPSAAFIEYFSIPRGRVVYHKDTGRYTILHGGLSKRNLNKIRKHFGLKAEETDYDTDFHYTLNPDILGL